MEGIGRNAPAALRPFGSDSEQAAARLLPVDLRAAVERSESADDARAPVRANAAAARIAAILVACGAVMALSKECSATNPAHQRQPRRLDVIYPKFSCGLCATTGSNGGCSCLLLLTLINGHVQLSLSSFVPAGCYTCGSREFTI